MLLKYPKVPFNFGGMEVQDFDKSKIVVLPVPYDSTASYRPGARDGPHAILQASRNMEIYDIELDKELKDDGTTFTLPELEPDMSSPTATVARVKEAVSQILDKNKFPLMLGGEHSLTPGAVKAVSEKFQNLTVLQIDAHADLRDSYENTKDNHACAMKRCRDLGLNVVQVGIRSMSKEEMDYVKQNNIQNIFFAPEVPIDKILEACTDNVYLTIDLDGIDPTLVPGTGTPVPGGLSWYGTLELIKEIAQKKNLVGADVMELAPIPGSVASDFLAAKLTFKIMMYKLSKECKL